MAKILIVDDHPENLLALRVILEDLGEELVMANSGPEAVELVASQDFAVILLDVSISRRSSNLHISSRVFIRLVIRGDEILWLRF